MRTFPFLLILLLTGASRQQDFFPKTIIIDGRLTRADNERLIEREFQVPAGTRRVEIEYVVFGTERRTVVNGAGGQTIDWIRNGEPIGTDGAAGGGRVVTARSGDWFSVVIRDSAGQVTAISNAIYVDRQP